MSRCFPFPPPGYGARGDALIESIKLREEMEKAKKEKKREKKEKRKQKKERKVKERTKITSHGSDEGQKFKVINEIRETKAGGKFQKGGDCDNEQPERSGITEELDQPVTYMEPCCLSDSTQSSKRKRSSPETGHDHGPPIKIRLPLRKHEEPEESNSKSKFQVGSFSGSVRIADSLIKPTLGSDRQLQCPMSTKTKRILGNSDSRHSKAVQNSVHGDALVTKNTIGSDCLLQHPKKMEPKQVLGLPVARYGKALQTSIHGDSVVTKNALGTEGQSRYLKNVEPKRVLGNSDCRQGKGLQNLVHGDVITKNSLGSDSQLQCSMRTEPKRLVVYSDSRHGKPLQKDLIHVGTVVTKNSPRSDFHLQGPSKTESKRAVGKPLQKDLVHADDVVVTKKAVDDESRKMVSLYNSLLQIPPLTYDGLDSLDEDWLFSSELTEAKPLSKKQKTDSDVFQFSTSSTSIGPPRAQYLPEVQIYALPYVVPF